MDVEIANRCSSELMKPKYMIRLDLELPPQQQLKSKERQNVEETSSDSLLPINDSLLAMRTIESHHLQTDYSNMKKLVIELQYAMEAVKSSHCQRIAKYVS